MASVFSVNAKMRGKKIVYIQHAHSIGGSVVSLKELVIDAKEAGYQCTVVCSNKVTADFYASLGVNTYVDIIAPFNHNSAYFYKFSFKEFLRIIKVLLKTVVSFFFIYKILKKEHPDIVHLNSSSLVLYTFYCWVLGIPNVLHVRESIVKGYIGIRRKIITWIVNRFSSAVVFISEFEYAQMPTNKNKSYVIYNYVHQKEFIEEVRCSDAEKKNYTLITLGGLFSLKGGDVLLKALGILQHEVELLVLGSGDPRIVGKEIERVEGELYTKEIIRLLGNPIVERRVKFIGSVSNPQSYIAAANALIFWASAPHFPRPVFEAWLLKKTVLYYNPGYNNSIINTGNVIAIKDGTCEELADKILFLIHNQEAQQSQVESSFTVACQNFTEKNFAKINSLYTKCLVN